MGLSKHVRIIFQNRAVVCHQPIDLTFHIRRLRIDGGRQSVINQRAEFRDQIKITGLRNGRISNRAGPRISPTFRIIPLMTGNPQADPAD